MGDSVKRLKLKVRKEVLNAKINVLHDEHAFIDMQLTEVCMDCEGCGKVEKSDPGKDWGRRLRRKPYVPKIINCKSCSGFGIICDYCGSAHNKCECGEFVEKNKHKYSYCSVY